MNHGYADMHCDTITTLYDRIQKHPEENLRHNSLQISLEGMQKAGYLLQNFAIFLNKPKYEHLYIEARGRISYFYQEMEQNKDIISPARSWQDIMENNRDGKMSALLTLEGGELLEGKMDNLYTYHSLGTRMLTLTWNYPNELGFPNFDLAAFRTSGIKTPDFTKTDNRNGLTPFGIEVLQEMERLHMIVDVSHGSDKLFWDVCKHSRKPFVASHSNARALRNYCRNLSDDMIRALAEHGGLMGMNFCADFISARSSADQITYTADIVNHMKHIYNTGGIDCIALGSDFDGIDNPVEFGGADGMEVLYHEMKAQGFPQSDCDKILRDNVLRLYRECL